MQGFFKKTRKKLMRFRALNGEVREVSDLEIIVLYLADDNINDINLSFTIVKKSVEIILLS